jgi:riboflavin kinase/FMN adenylyltransferase
MNSLLSRGVKPETNKIVLTIGNFDGMHLGHLSLFQEVVKLAKEEDAIPTLVTFYPHPKFYFAKQRNVTLPPEEGELSSPRQKFSRATQLGILKVVLLRFGQKLSELTPEEFFETQILPIGEIKGIVVGRDWCFGRNKAGTAQTLQDFGVRYGFKVKILEDQAISGERISSSIIRKKISSGDVQSASEFLGYHYSLSGHVKKGDQRGRLIGFPTMNLKFGNELLPAYGVYRTSTIVRGKSLPSITNVGVRPTFAGSKIVVETHVLEDYSGENYGERIKVSFIERLRAEKKFSGIEELKAQIEKDIQIAKGSLGKS